MDAGIELQTHAAMIRGQSAPEVNRTADPAKARQVAEDFEAFVLGQMLQPMFAELGAEAPFGGGMGEKMWRSMQVDEFGKAIARNGGIGIADAVMGHMLKIQETEN